MTVLNLFNSMTTFKEKAFAKINLSLKILNKRTDGYHNIESHVIFINIYDTISLQILNTRKKNIFIESTGTFSNKIKNLGKDNLCYKAALLFIKKYNIENDIVIKIKKNLPIASGIGGGSADAAATLKVLAKIYNIKLSKLINNYSYEISRELGADVPACLHSKKITMKNIGETIKNISYNTKTVVCSYKWIVLVTPNKEISTKSIFDNFNRKTVNNNNNPKHFNHLFKNDLKFYAEKIEPSVADAQKLLSRQEGIIFYSMSGSGPTCFGIFDTQNNAINAKNKIKFLKPKWWTNWSSIL